MIAFLTAYVSIIWLVPTAVLDRWDPQLKSFATLLGGLVLAFVILTDDVVEVTATGVRRRSHLSALLGLGFRTVDLEPGSWYTRSKYFEEQALWVGSRPHSSPKQELLTFTLRFEDDPRGLYGALRRAGVGIEDEHAGWVERRPVLARLEMGIWSVSAISISAASLGLLADPAAAALLPLALIGLVAVHFGAR